MLRNRPCSEQNPILSHEKTRCSHWVPFNNLQGTATTLIHVCFTGAAGVYLPPDSSHSDPSHSDVIAPCRRHCPVQMSQHALLHRYQLHFTFRRLPWTAVRSRAARRRHGYRCPTTPGRTTSAEDLRRRRRQERASAVTQHGPQRSRQRPRRQRRQRKHV